MKETKIAIPIRTSDCGRYCADCRWCWWGGHWEDPGCAVLSDEHGKRLPLEMSDHGPERPTACLAAEQQAQGDAEGLRAALRSAARDLQTANQWSWEARWPADRIRWFAERSEVCRAAAKAGLPPKRPVKAEDCPGSGEGEQGGGEWVAWTPERRKIVEGDRVRADSRLFDEDSDAGFVVGRVRKVDGDVRFGEEGAEWSAMPHECDLWISMPGISTPGAGE